MLRCAGKGSWMVGARRRVKGFGCLSVYFFLSLVWLHWILRHGKHWRGVEAALRGLLVCFFLNLFCCFTIMEDVMSVLDEQIGGRLGIIC